MEDNSSYDNSGVVTYPSSPPGDVIIIDIFIFWDFGLHWDTHSLAKVQAHPGLEVVAHPLHHVMYLCTIQRKVWSFIVVFRTSLLVMLQVELAKDNRLLSWVL